MNWGYKIMLFYLTFVAGIVFLVVRSMNEKIDLVTPDYYAEELKHQQKINQESNVNHLNGTMKCEVKDGKLVVDFPQDFKDKSIDAHLQLYYPADVNKDVVQNFNIKSLEYEMPIPTQNKGLHEIHLQWKADGVEYYWEKKVMI